MLPDEMTMPSTVPDATAMPTVKAEGVLFWIGANLSPMVLLVPNDNEIPSPVPMWQLPTGGWTILFAPSSTKLVSGQVFVIAHLFDATGTEYLGYGGVGNVVEIGEYGWSLNELEYAFIGSCGYGAEPPYIIDRPGSYVLRLVATDEVGTTVEAEVQIQPDCGLAALPERCSADCPLFADASPSSDAGPTSP